MKKLICSLLVLVSFIGFLAAPAGAYDKSLNYPVYRVYNPRTGEHLYTAAFGEASTLYHNYGWNIENVPWYCLPDGGPVYRLYNPGLDDHLYTSNTDEINKIQHYGWQLDRGIIFNTGGSMPIYRLYNPISGRHLLTSSIEEYNVLPKHHWRQEGIAFYGVPVSEVK